MFVVKLDNAVDPPITPESVVVPVVLSVNAKAPLTVPPKVISPAVFPEMVESAVKTIGVPASPINTVVLVDRTVPAILTWLGAVAVNPAANVIESPLASPKVIVPVL